MRLSLRHCRSSLIDVRKGTKQDRILEAGADARDHGGVLFVGLAQPAFL